MTLAAQYKGLQLSGTSSSRPYVSQGRCGCARVLVTNFSGVSVPASGISRGAGPAALPVPSSLGVCPSPWMICKTALSALDTVKVFSPFHAGKFPTDASMRSEAQRV